MELFLRKMWSGDWIMLDKSYEALLCLEPCNVNIIFNKALSRQSLWFCIFQLKKKLNFLSRSLLWKSCKANTIDEFVRENSESFSAFVFLSLETKKKNQNVFFTCQQPSFHCKKWVILYPERTVRFLHVGWAKYWPFHPLTKKWLFPFVNYPFLCFLRNVSCQAI